MTFFKSQRILLGAGSPFIVSMVKKKIIASMTFLKFSSMDEKKLLRPWCLAWVYYN